MRYREEIAAGAENDSRKISRELLDVIICFAALLVSYIIFLTSFFILDFSGGNKPTALGEVADLITSVDVSAQQKAFRLALIFLIIIWGGMYLFGETIREVVARRIHFPAYPRKNLFEAFGDSLSLDEQGLQENIKLFQCSRKLVKGLDFGLIIFTLVLVYSIIITTHHDHIYSLDRLVQITASDPHSYQIFARSCELRQGSITSNGDHEYYGPGASLLYCALRSSGFDGSYRTQYELIRMANYITLVGFIFSLLCFWRAIDLGILWRKAIAIVSLIIVIRPLVAGDDHVSFIANLSGLRYLPVINLLLIACCTKWSGESRYYILRLLVVSLGIAFFPDTGLLAAIGFIVMESISQSDLSGVIKAGALGSVLLFGFAVIISHLIVFLTGDTSASILQLFSLMDSGFAGIVIGWDAKMFFISSIGIVVTTYLVSSAGCNEKTQGHERTPPGKGDVITLAISLMILAWIPYYLHRPFDYLIFSLLLIFPFSWIASQASSMSRISSILVSIILIVIGAHISLPKAMILTDELRKDLNAPQSLELERWSGLMLPRQAVAHMRNRFAELDKLRTRDSWVITGMPSAVAERAGGFRAPIEAIFTLGQQSNLDQIITRILTEKPSVVILDGQDSIAWGAGAISKLVSRVETGISASYIKTDSSPFWRVWKLSVAH